MTQKIAVVTGGSRGIGKSIVLALAGAGYQVAFSYVRDEASAAALQAQVEGLGRDCLAVQCDVKDAPSIQAFLNGSSNVSSVSTCWSTTPVLPVTVCSPRNR